MSKAYMNELLSALNDNGIEHVTLSQDARNDDVAPELRFVFKEGEGFLRSLRDEVLKDTDLAPYVEQIERIMLDFAQNEAQNLIHQIADRAEQNDDFLELPYFVTSFRVSDQHMESTFSKEPIGPVPVYLSKGIEALDLIDSLEWDGVEVKAVRDEYAKYKPEIRLYSDNVDDNRVHLPIDELGADDQAQIKALANGLLITHLPHLDEVENEKEQYDYTLSYNKLDSELLIEGTQGQSETTLTELAFSADHLDVIENYGNLEYVLDSLGKSECLYIPYKRKDGQFYDCDDIGLLNIGDEQLGTFYKSSYHDLEQCEVELLIRDLAIEAIGNDSNMNGEGFITISKQGIRIEDTLFNATMENVWAESCIAVSSNSGFSTYPKEQPVNAQTSKP